MRLIYRADPGSRQKRMAATAVGVGAALAFWGPALLVHATLRDRFDARGAWALTLMLPVLTCAVVSQLIRRVAPTPEAMPSRWVGVLAIWASGPLMMTLSATFSGGGFAVDAGGGLYLALFGTIVFPAFCFMMATYDGTLFALLITTALLLTVCRPERADL